MDVFRTEITERLAERHTDSKIGQKAKEVCTAVAVAFPQSGAPASDIVNGMTGPPAPSSSGEKQPPLKRATRRRLIVDLSQPGLLRLPDVLELYRVSRSTWYAGIKSGLYEPGIPIGPRCVAWRSEYIRDLIANPPSFVRG